MMKFQEIITRFTRFFSKNTKKIATWYQRNRSQVRYVSLVLIGSVVFISVLVWAWNQYLYGYSKNFLVANTEQTTYRSGDNVAFHIVTLDNDHETVCAKELTLIINGPQRIKQKLELEKGQIMALSGCQRDTAVTTEPDYLARVPVSVPGTYSVKLIDHETGKKIRSSFTVTDGESETSEPVKISRVSTSRVAQESPERYPMVITVSSAHGFSGVVQDTIPAEFELAWYGEARITESSNRKTLSWDVSLEPGEQMELKYEYIPVNSSSCYVTMGPVWAAEKEVSHSTWRIVSTGDCTTI